MGGSNGVVSDDVHVAERALAEFDIARIRRCAY